MDKERTYQAVKDRIGQKPLEFSGNIGGGRAPLPIGEDSDKSSTKTQKGRTRKLINDTYRSLMDQQDGGKGHQGQGQQQGGQQG
ncbi:MAG: hypothetical protein EBS90_12950, partial [Betaproteobacteria bacterium]|nr:hypothetical protein [Betaproteobacteria bacterium]